MKVLITGATSGIGFAFAEYYAKLGYEILITGTTEKIVTKGSELTNKYGCKVIPIIMNIKTTADIDKFILSIRNHNIDILVNNAGFGNTGFFLTTDLERNIEMLQLHNILVLKLIHYFGNQMLNNNEGLVINVASLGGFLPIPQNAIYAATKSFLIKLSESLFLDFQALKTKVKIITVCPGFTRTNFHEKMGIPKDRQINKGIIKWVSPELVVKKTLKDLNNGKVISITGGFSSHIQLFLYNYLPKKMYNKIVLSIFS